MRILITGGSGYLGSVIVPILLERGYHVIVYDNLMYNQLTLTDLCYKKNFEFVYGDVRDYTKLNNYVNKSDCIIPLAGIVGFPACEKDKQLATAVNYYQIKDIVDNMSADQMLLFPNTNSGYGSRIDGMVTENNKLTPISHYGHTKCAEKELVKYAKKIIEHDKNAIILIHSDHGIDHLSIKHDHPQKKDLPDMSFENLLGVFAAFRMPERCNKFLDSENSAVNAFRIIFACLDNKQPVLLPHKIFVIDDDHTYVEGILEKNESGKYIIKDFNDE